MIEEFGSSISIRFLNPQCVKIFDCNGNEIEVPKCDKCGNFKNQIIGKEAFAWVCMNFDCNQDKPCGYT